MDQVIKFEKTYQQRLQEYREIFAESSPVGITQKFSFYLDLLMERSGWLAVWKIPRPVCQDFGINFPTVVQILVENIDLNKLTAAVKIVAVLDDIHLPEIHVVPLVELWPLKQQNQINIYNTSNALDIVRFFYINLYMPWDEDTNDWVEQHLQTRLQLFYDLKNGILPRGMAEHLRCLLTTAKHLQQQIEKEDCEEELIELQVSLLEIKKEVELLENPLARKVLIKRAENPEDTIGGKCWLICNEGLVEEYLQFINEAKEEVADQKIRIAPSISDALDVAASGDVFILKRGSHEINHMGALEAGGTLKSISGREETKITSSNNHIVFDLSADVLLEGFTINSSAQSAILVRSGKVTLKNCKIIDDNYLYSRQGVTVLNGAAVELKNCILSGFQIAIIANKNSSVTLENCEITDVNYGLKIYDNCAVQLRNTKVYDCKQYGIWIETKKALQNIQQLIGGFPILKE